MRGAVSRLFCNVALLAAVGKRCVDEAIAICGPGVPFSRIGDTIADVFEPAGFNSVHEFAGHGIGKAFHTRPYVLHFRNQEATTGTMVPGMTFTIEPMITEGSSKVWARVAVPRTSRARTGICRLRRYSCGMMRGPLPQSTTAGACSSSIRCSSQSTVSRC